VKNFHANIWTNNAEYLRPAYLEVNADQTSKLILFALESHIKKTPCRVVDIGGGGGSQAALLAGRGHFVTVVDIDPLMLLAAEKRFADLDFETRQRIRLIEGTAKDILGLELYDVVCCHSVLMYEYDWRLFVRNLAKILCPGGLLSIMSVNPEARAMRLGRQRRWREVIAIISTGMQHDPSCIPSTDVSRIELQTELESIDIYQEAWYGVGVFEDDDCSDENFAAEWLAGSNDPYRSVARCYHLVGRYDPKML
jgi:S-adenosylmethionine-dependent methyltransferase